MLQQWYYVSQNQRCGPCSQEQLLSLVESEEVQRTDLVWTKGMTNWAPAETIDGLAIATRDQPIQTGQSGLSGKSEGARVRLDWNKWNIGSRIIVVSVCIATASMFMTWVDVGIASANGLSQCAFVFLGIFVYPILMVLKDRPIRRIAGIACGAGGILLSMGYIASKEIELFGRSVNAASGGPYLFLLTCIALVVGVVQRKRQG